MTYIKFHRNHVWNEEVQTCKNISRADRKNVLIDIFGENDFLLKIPQFMCNTSFVNILEFTLDNIHI